MAATLAIRTYWINGYSAHLLSQFRDRQVYYHEREQSRLTSNGDLIGAASTATVIIDGMDQAKFACPRHLPDAKSLQDAMRPRLHVVGVRVAGFFNRGYICEPNIAKDGDLWIEIIYRVVEDLLLFCRSKGRILPSRLVIVSDNVGDNKSTYVFSFMAACIGSRYFRIMASSF